MKGLASFSLGAAGASIVLFALGMGSRMLAGWLAMNLVVLAVDYIGHRGHA